MINIEITSGTNSDNSKILILLDDYSRSVIKSNCNDLLHAGVTIIRELSELLTLTLDDFDKRIIIFDNYLRDPNALASLIVFKSLSKLEYIILGQNDALLSRVQNLGTIYKCYYRNFDYALLQAALYEDSDFQQNEIMEDSILPVVD